MAVYKGKIIDLDAYRSRKKRNGYVLPRACEMLTGNDISKLVKEGKWMGTYTPQAPYGKAKQLLPKKDPGEGCKFRESRK